MTFPLRMVRVSGLFGDRDVQVEFPDDHSTYFLYGRNGIGKTTVLRMVERVYRGALLGLRQVDFSELAITPREGPEIALRRSGGGLTLSIGGENVPLPEPKFEPHALRELRGTISELRPMWRQFAPGVWEDSRGRRIGTEDALEELQNELPDGLLGPEFEELREFLPSTRAILIPADRLYKGRAVEESWSHLSPVERRRRENATRHRGDRSDAQKWITDQINESQRRFFMESRRLEQTFPLRLLRPLDQPTLEQVQALHARVVGLEVELQEVGLASSERVNARQTKEVERALEEGLDVDRLAILHAYLTDALKKLEQMSDLANRMQLFFDLLQDRFEGKTVQASSDSGFTITTRQDQPLSVESLSSGEQQQLYLAAALLFREPTSSFVMIDEPELSLHVEWQRDLPEFLDRLTALRDHQFLLATHSPTIIGDRWDASVELVRSQ